jgi:hypothetical protein
MGDGGGEEAMLAREEVVENEASESSEVRRLSEFKGRVYDWNEVSSDKTPLENVGDDLALEASSEGDGARGVSPK